MSNEITFTFNLSVTNGQYSDSFTGSAQFSQSAQGASSGIATTSTALSDIPLASVTTNGWAVLKNIDASANCDFGYDDSGTFRGFGTLKPGESAIFRYKSGVVPALKAQSGTPKIQYWINND